MKTQRAKSLITFHFARESSNGMMSYQRNSNDRTVTGFAFRNQPYHGDRSFRLRVLSLTSRSPTSYVDPLRSETSAAHVYALFSQPWHKKARYACVYLVLSATDQAKAVRELTQLVRETTSNVCEQDVGETTVNPYFFALTGLFPSF